MAAAFLYDDLVADAAYIGPIGDGPLASLPLSNILDPQPRVRARWEPAAASIYVDFGAVQTVACVALIGTTLATGSTVRARVGNDAGFATSNWDTGAVDPATSAAAGGNVVFVNATSASGRFLRIDISDPTLGYLDIGRIVAGPLWRLTYAPAYGMAEGRMILDRRDRNTFTGAEFPVPAVVNPRMTTFSLPLITRTEATAEFRTMLARLGGVGDALWLPDDGLTLAETNLRAVFGAVVQPGDALLSRSYFNGHTRSFTMTERV